VLVDEVDGVTNCFIGPVVVLGFPEHEPLSVAGNGVEWSTPYLMALNDLVRADRLDL
jgi:hypothetical protein